MRKTLLIACALLLAAPPLAAQTTTDVADEPTGQGNPDDITCRMPQLIPNTRNRRGPKVCKTNAIWAQYREDGMTVSPDGSRDMPVPKGKNCQTTAAGSVSGTGSARGMGGGVSCE